MKMILLWLRGFLSKNTPVLFTKILYKHFVGHQLNLSEPRALTEKLQWLKLFKYSHDDLVKKCIDKYLVRDFIKERKCEEILIGLIGVWDDVNDISWDSLPEKFVLKCTHGCAFNIICTDKAKFDKNLAIKKLSRWMKTEYGLQNAETIYFGLTPKIICEEYIESEDGKELRDYKIFCSNGEPKLIYVITGGHGLNECLDYYTTDWQWIPVNNGTLPNAGDIVNKPQMLGQMLEYATILSKGFPIIRVDFYCERGKIIFGELTFLPTAGFSRYNPEKYDYEFGDMFDISTEIEKMKNKEYSSSL